MIIISFNAYDRETFRRAGNLNCFTLQRSVKARPRQASDIIDQKRPSWLVTGLSAGLSPPKRRERKQPGWQNPIREQREETLVGRNAFVFLPPILRATVSRVQSRETFPCQDRGFPSLSP